MMADKIHSILFAYPALTGLVLAMAALAIVLRVIRWWEDRRAPLNERVRRAF
jgi:hypothetical protein